MSNFDLRGLLQYVPQFRGRTFVVLCHGDLIADEIAWRDACLDLEVLQGIGLGLVLAVPEKDSAVAWEQLVRVDLKLARAGADEVSQVLRRGQAALFTGAGNDAAVAGLARGIGASKIIILQAGRVEPKGAVRVPESLAGQPELVVRGGQCCGGSVSRVHFINGRRRSAILSELFSNEGVGLMVYTDAYQQLQELREEDIPELLSLIGRPVVDAHLIDRSYEDILARLTDYHLLRIDGNLVGSVALHTYPGTGMAEIACLRIKESHGGLGYGRLLVHHAEALARDAGAEAVFALTSTALDFFRERVGYEPWDSSAIPESRSGILRQSGRASKVFGKKL